jgi:parvulin-like peptidyl-prolyl isomerase
VFRLDSLQPAGVPPLAQIRPLVEQVVRNSRKGNAARKVAQEYLKRLDAGSPMGPAADAMQLPYREFGPFTRVNPPINNPILVGAAFGLDVGKRSGILETKDGLYVVQVLERTKADSAQFVKELDQFRSRATNQARQERVRLYLGALREAAKVVDNRSKVLQQAAPAQTS